jgi:hypothetical protein
MGAAPLAAARWGACMQPVAVGPVPIKQHVSACGIALVALVALPPLLPRPWSSCAWHCVGLPLNTGQGFRYTPMNKRQDSKQTIGGRCFLVYAVVV